MENKLGCVPLNRLKEENECRKRGLRLAIQPCRGVLRGRFLHPGDLAGLPEEINGTMLLQPWSTSWTKRVHCVADLAGISWCYSLGVQRNCCDNDAGGGYRCSHDLRQT